MDLDQLLGIDRRDPKTRLALHLVDEDHRLVESLIRLRRASGLTQQDVAERMGVTQSAVARIETSQRDPRLSTLRRYAMAVGACVSHTVEAADSSPRISAPRGASWVDQEPVIEQSLRGRRIGAVMTTEYRS